MDDLESKVASIEDDLRKYRQRLQVLEADAQKSVGDQTQSLRDALTNGDGEAHHVSTEIQLCLADIESHTGDTTAIDLAPQMTWLTTRLGTIITNLETAQSCAETAIGCVSEYTYSIIDVSHEIADSRTQLNDAEGKCEVLAQTAKSDLETSESVLRYTQAKISSTERDIRSKSSEISSKLSRSNTLNSQVSAKNQQIRDAERRVEKKKDRALIKTGIGIFGVLMAPVSGGASLLLTAGAAAGTAVNMVDISDLKKDIRQKNSAINDLQRDIAQARRDISLLESQKERLESRVKEHAADASYQRRRQEDYRTRIADTKRVKEEITTLDEYAAATIATIEESRRELQKAKARLDECSATVKEHAAQLQPVRGAAERTAGKKQLQRDFERRRKLLESVSGALGGMRGLAGSETQAIEWHGDVDAMPKLVLVVQPVQDTNPENDLPLNIE
ncbi:hypothetical protein TWF696_001582 [Orbilia brochopaga]|uniref:Uncharacterized protein n=1 Tax=Orbilia brochopaga TaxID=3140254 RepID=A0AAV9UC29_9PEZI